MVKILFPINLLESRKAILPYLKILPLLGCLFRLAFLSFCHAFPYVTILSIPGNWGERGQELAGDAPDGKAVRLIVEVLGIHVGTVEVQVSGVDRTVRSRRPVVAVRAPVVQTTIDPVVAA